MDQSNSGTPQPDSSSKGVWAGHAFTGDYEKELTEAERERKCPFCNYPHNLLKNHKDGTYIDGKYWAATGNSYSYPEARVRLLIVHKEHISHIHEIQPEGWMELQNMMAELAKMFDMEGYSMVIRSGDGAYTGATIDHLHCHMVTGPNDGETKVLTRIG